MNTRRKSLIALLLLPLAFAIAFATAGIANASHDSAQAAGKKTATITISSFRFQVPASVKPGTKIKVVNKDSVTHTVTSDTGLFDVSVDPGAKGFFTAPKKAGAYPFSCEIHPNMKATLTVAK